MAAKDYYAIVEGYNLRKRKEAELLRLSVWAGKASWEGSISYQQFCNQFFPLWFDEREDEAEYVMSNEEIEALFEQRKKYR